MPAGGDQAEKSFDHTIKAAHLAGFDHHSDIGVKASLGGSFDSQ